MNDQAPPEQLEGGAGDGSGASRSRWDTPPQPDIALRRSRWDTAPQPDIAQGKSQTRARHNPKETTQQGGAGVSSQSAASTSGPNASMAHLNRFDEREEDQPSLDDDSEEGEDSTGDKDEEENPKAPTAKMQKKMDKMAQMMRREAGYTMLTLNLDDLTPTPSKVTWGQDEASLLCSYNWQGANDGTNTIFVPGGPARFISQHTMPHYVAKDQGFQAADYNYVRRPHDPYAPLFAALGAMNPGVRMDDVDVIADRNNLRILLEFCQGKLNGPLRLDVYLVHNTLVLARKGERFWMRQSTGIGNNFEKNFTRSEEGMEDATSHYRAIRYAMGPLEVVVRFEADAYYDESTSDELDAAEFDAVTGALLKDRPHYDFKPPVRFLQKGHIIPTAQIAELKTVTYKEDGTSSVACQDQLWFGRTAHLLTGVYQMEGNKGKVLRIKYENAKERVDRWEEKNQEALRKLVDLLTRLRDVLKQQPSNIRSGILVRESKDGPLVFRAMLRPHPIIAWGFVSKHWTARLTGDGRTSNTRGRGQPDGPHRGRPQRGHTQSNNLGGHMHQSRPGGNGAAVPQNQSSHEGQLTWQQQQLMGANNFQGHQGHRPHDPQPPSPGFRRHQNRPQNEYGRAYNHQRGPDNQSGWDGSRGSGYQGGHAENRESGYQGGYTDDRGSGYQGGYTDHRGSGYQGGYTDHRGSRYQDDHANDRGSGYQGGYTENRGRGRGRGGGGGGGGGGRARRRGGRGASYVPNYGNSSRDT